MPTDDPIFIDDEAATQRLAVHEARPHVCGCGASSVDDHDGAMFIVDEGGWG